MRHVMKGLVLFASSAVHISIFAPTTFGTPIESHLSPDVRVKAPLVARQEGTYSGVDANINASLAGTYDCFRGGTWMLQSEMTIPINNVCGAEVYQPLEFTPFSFEPHADGAYPAQGSDYQNSQHCFDVSHNCDASGQKGKGYFHFTANFAAGTHANRADCEYALGRVRDLCHGDNGWSRGGWFTFIDGTTYGVDPSRNGQNQ